MKYLSAYMLSSLGESSQPKADQIKKVFNSVGITFDDHHINLVIGSLDGKNLNELIASGKTKLATVPIGGAPSAPTAASVNTPKEEQQKEEQQKEESDDDMGFGLFD